MSATVGDRIRLHSNSVDTPDRVGTIVAVLGSDDGPPYRVRFESGAESIISPGPDAIIEPAGVGERLGAKAEQVREDATEAVTEAAQVAKDTAENATGAAARAVSGIADAVAKRFDH